MEVPDKIYVSIRDLQYGYTTDVCLSQEEGYSAYIRKDALIEWLEHAKTVYNIRGANTFELLTLQMVIEYINSM